MKVIRDRTISDEVIVIDDVYIENCQIFNCELVYRGGDVNLLNTANSGCRWTFQGPAMKTIELLRTLGILKGNPADWIAVPNKPFNEA